MLRVCLHGYGAFYLMLTGDKSYHTVSPHSKSRKAYNLLSTSPVAAGTCITMQIEGIQIYRTLNPDFLDVFLEATRAHEETIRTVLRAKLRAAIISILKTKQVLIST